MSNIYNVPGYSKEISVEYDKETGRQYVPYFDIEARALGIDGRPVHQEGTLWVTATEVGYYPDEYADGYINILTPYED